MIVKCIKNSNCPEDVNKENWIKLNEEYTLIKVVKLFWHPDLFLVLKEINPNNNSYPSNGYNYKDFDITLDKINELIKENLIEYQEINESDLHK